MEKCETCFKKWHVFICNKPCKYLESDEEGVYEPTEYDVKECYADEISS